MKLSAIHVIKQLEMGPSAIRELAQNVGLSYPRTAAIVKEVVRDGYCEKLGKDVRLASNAKTVLLRKLADRYDLATLLGGLNEEILVALSETADVIGIQRRAELAQSTVYQTLGKLMSIGAVQRRDDRYMLANDPDLRAFSELLAREREAAETEPHAILIYRDDFKLKKVSAGKPARGSRTAFSLFTDFGVEYSSPHDYYVEPGHEVSIEDVLVHALRSAEGKAERTMCAVFYLKNMYRIDPSKTKLLAKRFGVLPLWADLQSYVKGMPVHEADKFLPWDEFSEKAALYGIRVSPPPEAEKSVNVLRDLGARLNRTVHAYLFGGANLLLRGLKKATKDFDIVLETKEDFSRMEDALVGMGFEPLAKERFAPSDEKLNPGGIYVSKGLPRFDLFTGVICNALFLTGEMEARAKSMAFGKLVLHLLSLEDVSLLKSITEREGDLEDMATIVRLGGDLDWGYILETYLQEEEVMKKHLCFTMLDVIESLQEREGITIPIHGALLRHCTDIGILQALSRGAAIVKDIRKMIDFPEYTIRNRIRKLVEEGKISKRKRAGHIVLTITDRGRASLFGSGS